MTVISALNQELGYFQNVLQIKGVQMKAGRVNVQNVQKESTAYLLISQSDQKYSLNDV